MAKAIVHIFRMELTFNWNQQAKRLITSRGWNVSDRTRSRWIERMNNCPQSIVTFRPENKHIELKIVSSVDSIPYCAALTIEIQDFDRLFSYVQTFWDPK